MDDSPAPSPLKRKGSRSDLPPLPSSSSKKVKTSPSTSPSPSSSSSPDPSSIPSLDEKPHSETDVRILQHQNRHLYFHLREKDRRIQEAERREREWEAQCARWQQHLSTLLSSWDEVVHDVQLCTRRIGADEVPSPPTVQGRRKPRNAVLRLLLSSPASSSAEGKDDPMDSDADSGSDPSASDGADEDEQTQVEHLLHSRVSYAHDLVASLSSQLLALREENQSLRAVAKGEAKEGSEVYLLWEKNEELTKKVEEMGQVVTTTMKEAADVRQRAEQLHHELVFGEEQRRVLQAERQHCEADWLKAQRKVDKLDKEREMWMKKQKEGALKAIKAEPEQGHSQPASSSSSSSSVSSSPALPFDDLVDRSALEALEEEKRELQQRLTEAAAKADKRAAELGKMRTELHKKEAELTRMQCEGVSEEGVKESLPFKLLQNELQLRRDEVEMARVHLAKYARELQEKEVTQQKEREGQQREMERMLRSLQDKEAQMAAELDRTSRAQTRAERDREEAQARYDALADKPAEERKREEDDRRRLMEGMERTIQQQDVELHAMREQLQSQQSQHDPSAQKWIVKAIKLQRRLEERDAQLQLLLQQQAAPASLPDFASIAALQSQLSSVQQQLSALTDDPELVSTLTDTNSALMSELDDLATAHSELSSQHSRLQVSFTELQRDRSALYGDKLKFKTMETLVRAKCSAHEQTIAALKGEAATLADSNRALDAWKGAMEDSARRFEQLKAAMERRVMDAQALIGSSRAELAKVKEERMAQAKAYKERGRVLEERDLKLQELDKKYQNAKEHYTTVLQQLRALQDKQQQAKQQQQTTSVGGGGGEGSGGAQSDAELELNQLKRRMKCGVCSDRDKSVVISKCWHLFCFDCVEANLAARHRKCPACGIKFDRPDVHTVYGLQG